MIATILPSSTTFHAVDYNERKVAEGVAELLEMKNFGFVGQIEPYTPDQLKQYLTLYTSRNERIKVPQFHLAISCRGDECSYEQLMNIAHQYLKEMGYGEDGQPILIYAHHDTDNHHLHIVTSRVAPDGHKIDDHHERIRSQEIINRIMGENQGQRASETIKKALEYRFASLNQFKAILESCGYECYEKDGNLCIKRGGHVVDSMPIARIQQHCQSFVPDEKRSKQLRAILLKYRDMTANKEELRTLMKQKFVDMYRNEPDTFRLQSSESWFTVPSEWKKKAKCFAEMDSVESRTRLLQMLGLPLSTVHTQIVAVYVDAKALFRPSRDPEITDHTSQLSYPKGVSANHHDWFEYNVSFSYEPGNAYPWTQLGYTYDWHNPDGPHVGLSEFVAFKGTLAKVKYIKSCWQFIQELQNGQ